MVEDFSLCLRQARWNSLGLQCKSVLRCNLVIRMQLGRPLLHVCFKHVWLNYTTLGSYHYAVCVCTFVSNKSQKQTEYWSSSCRWGAKWGVEKGGLKSIPQNEWGKANLEWMYGRFHQGCKRSYCSNVCISFCLYMERGEIIWRFW